MNLGIGRWRGGYVFTLSAINKSDKMCGCATAVACRRMPPDQYGSNRRRAQEEVEEEPVC